MRDRRVTQPVLRWPDGAIGGDHDRHLPLSGVRPGSALAWKVPAPEQLASTPWGGSWTGSCLRQRPTAWSQRGRTDGSENAPLIGLPGTAVSQTIRLDNIGTSADTVDLLLDGGPWPIDLELPDGRHVDANTQLTLDGCSGGPITATVAIPPGQPRDARSIHTLRFVSRGDPASTAAVTVTAKTPAPILFVDDERWYDHQDAVHHDTGRAGAVL